MLGRKVSRTNIGLGVGSYAWSIPFNVLFRAVLSVLQVFIILIAVVVWFWSILAQKKTKEDTILKLVSFVKCHGS